MLFTKIEHDVICAPPAKKLNIPVFLIYWIQGWVVKLEIELEIFVNVFIISI